MSNLSEPIAFSPEKKQLLRSLRPYLHSQILGQNSALDQIIPLLQSGELGIRDPRRPLGSFLLMGPTGVGKTETTLAFSRFLHGDDKLIRLDMSEFKTAEQLSTLLGTPTQAGLLESSYKITQGSGTLLLDEIEKANPLFFDLLLQILDAARITLANGKTLNLHGYYVVMTSNIASEALLQSRNCSDATRKRFLETQVTKIFRPETFARIDEVVMFGHLEFGVRKHIAEHLIQKEVERLRGLGQLIDLSTDDITELANAATTMDENMGARPIRAFAVNRLQSIILERHELTHTE